MEWERYAINAYDTKGHCHLVETLASKDQLTLYRAIMNVIKRLQKDGGIIQNLHTKNEKDFGDKFYQILKDEGIK